MLLRFAAHEERVTWLIRQRFGAGLAQHGAAGVPCGAVERQAHPADIADVGRDRR